MRLRFFLNAFSIAATILMGRILDTVAGDDAR
jgi:hypothetical protein